MAEAAGITERMTERMTEQVPERVPEQTPASIATLWFVVIAALRDWPLPAPEDQP
jgi:hypothetical protein